MTTASAIRRHRTAQASPSGRWLDDPDTRPLLDLYAAVRRDLRESLDRQLSPASGVGVLVSALRLPLAVGVPIAECERVRDWDSAAALWRGTLEPLGLSVRAVGRPQRHRPGVTPASDYNALAVVGRRLVGRRGVRLPFSVGDWIEWARGAGVRTWSDFLRRAQAEYGLVPVVDADWSRRLLASVQP